MPFWILCILVFAATFVADVCWTKYTKAAANNNALEAANWSVGIIAIGAFTLIVYVHDNWLLVPELFGAWLGTYWAVRTGKK